MHNMLYCSLQDQFAGPRDEFSNEVDLLAKIDHRNLVRLLGFTDKGNERIIITEYVPNGTLREHLDGKLCFPYCFLHFSVNLSTFKYYMTSSILQVNMAESWILISAWKLQLTWLMHLLTFICMQVYFLLPTCYCI